MAETQACILCNRSDDDYGGLLSGDSISAHYQCMLFSECLYPHGSGDEGIIGFLEADIIDEANAAKLNFCCYCHEFNASLACAAIQCQFKYHYPCGFENKAGFDYLNMITHCHEHNTPLILPERIKNNMKDHSCVICLEELTPEESDTILWATCCKANVFHKTCVTKYANSAGSCTKCPACNNQDEFLDTIRKHGVHIPDKEPEWEEDGLGFSELYQEHSSCDVEICKNPYGRLHNDHRGRWRLYLCNYCAAHGSHRECGMIISDYICPTCSFCPSPKPPSPLLDSPMDVEETALTLAPIDIEETESTLTPMDVEETALTLTPQAFAAISEAHTATITPQTNVNTDNAEKKNRLEMLIVKLWRERNTITG